MNPSLAGALFRAGARARNPSLFSTYGRLKEQEARGIDGLRSVQLERLYGLLDHAQRHSPFYRRRFEEAGFSPRGLSVLGDLGGLPVITKRDLIENTQEIHSRADFPKTLVAETSGTSGEALEFRRSEAWDSANRASLMRFYDWYGVNLWDRHGYLWGYDIAPRQALPIRFADELQNRFRLFTYDRSEIRRFTAKLRGARYLAGYSSMIYEVAKLIVAADLPRPRLALVKGTSENILDAYREPVLQAFGQPIRSEYGAAEAGIIAFECPMGSLHINIDNVVLEVDEGGGAVVTNLNSHSFPIIRYALGDRVVLRPEAQCSCGSPFPVLDEVQGREGGVVVGRERRFPALTFYYVFKNLAIRHGVFLNYRAEQNEAGAVTLRIEGPENRPHEDAIREELSKYFGEDLDVILEFQASIRIPGRKAVYFISSLGAESRDGGDLR